MVTIILAPNYVLIHDGFEHKIKSTAAEKQSQTAVGSTEILSPSFSRY